MYKYIDRTRIASWRKGVFAWLTVLTAFVLSATRTDAQVAAYSFGVSSGSYTALSAPTNVYTGTWDDNAAVNVPIGFSFTFNGVAYTTVNIHPNGYITFGATTSGYTPISGGSGASGIVAVWGRDLQGVTGTGSVDYKTTGSTFTVQWSNARRYNGGTANTESINMQIQLEQTTNVVRLVYGTWSDAGNNTASGDNTLGEVGLRGASGTDFKNLQVLIAGNWATPTNGGSNNVTTYYNQATVAVKPASGLTYTYSPPPPCVAPVDQPTAPSAAAVVSTSNQISGSFTAAGSTPSGYLVVRYPSAAAVTPPVQGTAYTAGNALGLGTVVQSSASTTFLATGLTPSTTYDFYIYAYNNTACVPVAYNLASPITVSATTNGPQSATSTAIGGLWSSPATWTSGVVPGTADDATIAAGAIVTIDQAVTQRHITVNGILQWNGTSNAITTNGNFTVASGGTLYGFTTGGTGQQFNLLGNLVVNGSANLSLAFLIFTGTGAQAFNGSGTLVGNGTNPLVAGIQMQGTGTLTISGSATTNLQLRTWNPLFGTTVLPSGFKIEQGSSQVFGQAINGQINNVAVTAMGSGYTTAPVVGPNGSANWAATTAVIVGNVRVAGINVYVATVAGTTGAVAPNHPSGTATDGTVTWLWVGFTGTIGNALIPTVVAGTQYFYGANLYTATVGGAINAASPPTHLSGSVASGAATFQYVGSPATVSVNYDAVNLVPRTLTITSSGAGYANTSPGLVILNTGAGTGATAVALSLPAITGGNTQAIIQKNALATVTGTSNIPSSQGISGMTATVGGVYLTTPSIAIAGPTGINLVTAGGSGYTANPTGVTITGGTLLTGATAYVASDFTYVITGGVIRSVVLNASGAKYVVQPTSITTTGGGGTGATWSFGANAATATAVLNANGQLTNITITNAGGGYVAAPTVALTPVVVGETAASINARVDLFNLAPGFFGATAITGVTVPAAVNGVHNEATNLANSIPSNRRINNLATGGSTGVKFTGDITLYNGTPITLGTAGPIDMATNTLIFSHPQFVGIATSNALHGVTVGSIELNGISAGGARTFPVRSFDGIGLFAGSQRLNLGTGTAFTGGTDITRLKLTITAAPSGASVGGGNMTGVRAYRIDVLAGTAFGTTTLPTFQGVFDALDGLVSNNPTLFLSQSNTSISTGWTVRTVTTGSGSLPASGSRTTATTGVGPIVFASTMYFGWSSTFVLPPALAYNVTRTTNQTYQSIAPVINGGNGLGTLSGSGADETVAAVVPFSGFTFNYQGSPCTGFTIHPDGFIVLNNGLYTYAAASAWDNTLGAASAGGTPDVNKRNVIAPCYDDWNKPSPVIYYHNTDSLVTIEWFNTTFFGLAGPQLYFQVVLRESDQSITFNYGDMQNFNGTTNIRYSYTTGISGAFVSAIPQAGQVFQQQYENYNLFSHENSTIANWGANGLTIAPEPHSRIKLTPGAYSPPSAPAPTAPDNDEAATAEEVPALTAFPNNIAWNYTTNKSNIYTSRYATHSAEAVCGGSATGKDVWFKFLANDPNMIVRIYASGGYIPRLQILDQFLAPVSCQVGTQGVQVQVSLTGLTPGDYYYARVSHETTGVTALATATLTDGVVTGVTVNTPGTNYSVPATSFGYVAANQGPIMSFSGGGGAGAVGALTNPTTPTQVLPSLTTSNLGFYGGSGYVTPPTVTIESPDWGITGQFGIIVYSAAANDECATAQGLTPALSGCTDNTPATTGNADNTVFTGNASASAEASCAGIASHDVWYKFTTGAVPVPTLVTVSGATGFDPVIEVWNGQNLGGNCGTKVSMGCTNATGANGTESVTLSSLVANRTYFVRVYDAAGVTAGASFSICITTPCFAPTAVTAGSITATDANISWTASVSSPGSYVAAINTTGATPTNASPGVTAVSGGLASVINGGPLSSSSTYYVFVRSVCSPGDTSVWSPAYSFNTLCGTVMLPACQGLNSATPACWTTAQVTGATSALSYVTASVNPSGLSASEGSGFFMYNSWNATTGDQIRLQSPSLNSTALTSVEVKFDWAKSNYDPDFHDNVTVQYSLNNGSTWISVLPSIDRQDDGIDAGDIYWSAQSVTLPPAAAGISNLRVGFLFTSEFGYNCFIDNICLVQSPTCYPPVSITAGSNNTDTGNFAWLAPVNGITPPANGYLWDVNPTNAAPAGLGTAEPGLSASENGLSAATTYYFSVRSVCAVGDTSSWSSPVPFTTYLANDNVCDAELITCSSLGFGVPGTTINAHFEASYTPCNPAYGSVTTERGVWYQFNGNNKEVKISTCDPVTSYDSRLTVYSGTCGSLSCVTANDDGPDGACDDGATFGLESEVTFQAYLGTTYYIFVHGYQSGVGLSSTGDFILSGTCTTLCSPIPTNDECASAQTFSSLPTTCGAVNTKTGNTSCASPSVIAPPSCGSAFQTYNDLWYKFTATGATTNITGTFSSPVSPYAVIYSGACGSLVPVQCALLSSGVPATMNTQSGVTYYLRMATIPGGHGLYSVCVTSPAPYVGPTSPSCNNDAPTGACTVVLSGNAYPSATLMNGNNTNASNSAQSIGTGADVWYRFVAPSTGVSITLATPGYNGRITLYNSVAGVIGSMVADEDTRNVGDAPVAIPAPGPAGATDYVERLNASVVTGNEYYISVGTSSGAATGPYQLYVQYLLPSSCNEPDPGPAGYSICTNYKARFYGAAPTYTLHFVPDATLPMPTGTSGVETFANAPAGSSTISLSTPALALYNGGYYDVFVDVTYNLRDGDNTLETIPVLGITTCQDQHIASQNNVEVKASMRCDNLAVLSRSGFVQATPVIQGAPVCNAQGYTFSFRRAGSCGGAPIDLPGDAIVVDRPGITCPLSYLPANPGIGYWRVEIRPIFAAGIPVGTYGPPQWIQVNGTAAMSAFDLEGLTPEADRSLEMTGVAANLYPNPNNGQMVNLNVSGVESDNVFVRIVDGVGRVVYSNRFTVDGSLNTIVTFERALSDGLYIVEFTVDGKVVTERMMVSK